MLVIRPAENRQRPEDPKAPPTDSSQAPPPTDLPQPATEAAMAAADASKAAGPAVAAASTAPASGSSTMAATEEVGVDEIEVAAAGETPARWGMQGTAVEPKREDAEDEASVLAAAAEAMCVANRSQLCRWL